ncbi:MAG: hypothetical protein ACREJB_05275, partial [Planctomycetaceae bacterium]
MSRPVLTRRLEELCTRRPSHPARGAPERDHPSEYVPDRSVPAAATGRPPLPSRSLNRWRTAAGLTILATLAAVGVFSSIGRTPTTGTAAPAGREIRRSVKMAETSPRPLELPSVVERPASSFPLTMPDDSLPSAGSMDAANTEPYRRTADALTADALTADAPVPFAAVTSGPLPTQVPDTAERLDAAAPATDEAITEEGRDRGMPLLAQARAAMQQGKFADARARIEEARRLGLDDAGGPDSPQAMLAELERTEAALAGPRLEGPALEERVPVLPDVPADEITPHELAMPLLPETQPAGPDSTIGSPADPVVVRPEPA